MIIFEQAAVEPINGGKADLAARVCHGGEQGLRIGGEIGGLAAARFEHFGEQMIGQQPDIFGEHAEHQPVDEMRHQMRRMAAIAQPLRQRGELAGGFLGQGLPGFRRLEDVGIGEGGAQFLALASVDQVFKVEIMHLLHRVGPVGVDADAVHVGHDEQRRIFQRDAVLQKLVERRVEVLARAFIFPGEAAAFPDIGPAFAAAGFGGAFFKGEPFAFRIGGDGIGDARQRAKIVEMALRSGALVQLAMLPFFQEFISIHIFV